MEPKPAADVDLAPLLKAVRGVGHPLEAGLWESWREPARFVRALLAHVAAHGEVAPKSVPGQGVDLYHDLVARHLRQEREALVYYAAGAGWRRVSFDELHARVTALCGTWEQLGAEPGQGIALVLPVGAEYAVTLLAALRLGLVVSPLPPRGRAFVRTRLQALAPDHVVSLPRYLPMLGEWSAKQLPAAPDPAARPIPALRSFTAPPDAPAARLFSPLGPEPALPVERSADSLFLGLLRDAVVTLGLGPQDRFALPGFDPVQFQPWALMTSLFAGACYLELEEADLMDPERLSGLAPRVVGVTRAARDALLALPEPPTLRLWLRNPAEPYDWERWGRFAQRMAEGRPCRGMNLLANAAFGGAFLASAQLADPQLQLLPVCAEPWQLGDLTGSGEPALGGSGLYTPLREGAGPQEVGQFLLGQSGAGFALAGSLTLLSEGQVYPEDEAVALATELSSVLGAEVALAAHPGTELNRAHVTLVVFRDPLQPESAVGELRAELEERLALELGPRALPHLFRFYPLVPRRAEGGIDRDWCRWQFMGGALDKKRKEPMFRAAARLRRLVHLARPPGPAT
jgi:hypothetical protein